MFKRDKKEFMYLHIKKVLFSIICLFGLLPLEATSPEEAFEEAKRIISLFQWSERSHPFRFEFIDTIYDEEDEKRLDTPAVISWDKKQPIVIIQWEEFKKLSPDMQCFILAHEIAHNQQREELYFPFRLLDSFWGKMFFSMKTCVVLSLTGIFMYALAEARKEEKYGLIGTCLTVCGLVLPFLKSFLSKKVEYDADKRAALTLQSIAGGKAYFNYFIPRWNLLAQLLTPFNSHPSPQARIQALEKLKQNYNLADLS